MTSGQRKRRAQARFEKYGEPPRFFGGDDPPANLSIRRDVEASQYVFTCVCAASVRSATVPTKLDTARVEGFARKHAGCRN